MYVCVCVCVCVCVVVCVFQEGQSRVLSTTVHQPATSSCVISRNFGTHEKMNGSSSALLLLLRGDWAATNFWSMIMSRGEAQRYDRWKLGVRKKNEDDEGAYQWGVRYWWDGRSLLSFLFEFRCVLSSDRYIVLQFNNCC